MNVRAFLAIIAIIFLGLTAFIVWSAVTPPVASPSTTTAPVGSTSTTPTPTPTPTPSTLVERFAARTNDLTKELTSPFLALGELAATLIIIGLGLFLIWRIWYLSGLPNLIIDTFNNATGNKDLDNILTGLNQLTRERLAKVLEGVQNAIEKGQDVDPSVEFKFPKPETGSEEQLTSLLTSLKSKDVTSGVIQSALQLMSVVFMPRGVKVTPTIQSKGDTPATPGISFQVADLQNKQEPVLYTFWEPKDISSEVASPQQVVTSTLQSPLPMKHWWQKLLHPQQAATSIQPSPTPSQEQAQCYYEVGIQLHGLCFYQDAINYFEEALKCLKCDTSSDAAAKVLCDEAAKALAESLSCSQRQQSGVSAYTVGKQLQDAGLSLLAIESYKKSLLSTDQVPAEKAWKIVLKLTHNNDATDEAIAYLTLARLYKKNDVYLFDQSLDLYKAAIARGSREATTELQDFQLKAAKQLTEAGRLLKELMLYAAAEKYLMAALVKVPSYPQAQDLLATVKKIVPPEENKDALAFYTLGQLYEGQRALDQAKSQYENALTKQPDFDTAKDALQRVLQARKTPEEYFLELMEPAAAWMAIEVAQRSMEAYEGSFRYYQAKFSNFISPRPPKPSDPSSALRSKNYQARLYNFIGYFHQYYAYTFYRYPHFYELAIDDFKKAINHDEKWFQPYENLGDTYAMWAQEKMVKRLADKRMVVPPGNQSMKYAYEALTNFDKALHCLQPEKRKRRISSKEKRERKQIERRIQVGKYNAQLLTGDTQLINEAIAGIHALVGKFTVKLLTGNIPHIDEAIKDVGDGWDITSEKDEVFLYNLACWYGIVPIVASEQFDITTAKQAALYYVIYSMARNKNQALWNWAPDDPCFISIFNRDKWEKLILVLTQKIYQDSKLSELVGTPFADAIKDVLNKVDWLNW